MTTLLLLDNLCFDEKHAHAEPLLVDESGRVLRFSLRPGQSVREHCAAHSPVHIVVLQGKGRFAGEDGAEVSLGPNELKQEGLEALTFYLLNGGLLPRLIAEPWWRFTGAALPRSLSITSGLLLFAAILVFAVALQARVKTKEQILELRQKRKANRSKESSGFSRMSWASGWRGSRAGIRNM